MPEKKMDKLNPSNSNAILGFLREASESQKLTNELFKDTELETVASSLVKNGILTSNQLALRALSDIDIEAEAKQLNLSAELVKALHQTAIQTLTKDQLLDFKQILAQPKQTGGLDPKAPDYKRRLKEIEQIPLATPEQLKKIGAQLLNPFVPLGPTKAIDHRPCLGPPRDQGPAPTCSAFGATVVIEALEFLRDRRMDPIDLSEEFCWWSAKGGQTISGANGDTVHMLSTYVFAGGCEEWLLPYKPEHILNNWAHVPVSEEPIDRALLP